MELEPDSRDGNRQIWFHGRMKHWSGHQFANGHCMLVRQDVECRGNRGAAMEQQPTRQRHGQSKGVTVCPPGGRRHVTVTFALTGLLVMLLNIYISLCLWLIVSLEIRSIQGSDIYAHTSTRYERPAIALTCLQHFKHISATQPNQ